MSRARLLPAFAAARGDHQFWDVIASVSETARRERREYFDFDEWDWIFRSAEYSFHSGDGFPPFMQPALARKRRLIAEARDAGISAEQMWRNEEAVIAWREQRDRRPPAERSAPRSSRGRARLVNDD